MKKYFTVMNTCILPGYVNFLAGEGKCQPLLLCQFGYEEETGNSYQWQVHSLTKRAYVTVPELSVHYNAMQS
jgi:hypothetical protein